MVSVRRSGIGLCILILHLSATKCSTFVATSSCRRELLYLTPTHCRRQSLVALKMSESPTTDTEEPTSLLVSNMHQLGSDGDDKIRLILASQSPRRREILDMLGLANRYTATPSPLDESALQTQLVKESLSPIEYTRVLAEKKAEALALVLSNDSTTPSTLVLGSDTIVDLNGSILEKPTDTDSAISMLTKLSGEWHQVHTGVAIYHVQGNIVNLIASFTDTARVQFAKLSTKDIEAYVATKEPMDKAGSYGIQGIGGQLVSCVEGDFFTVMGLPGHRTSKVLSQAVTELRK